MSQAVSVPNRRQRQRNSRFSESLPGTSIGNGLRAVSGRPLSPWLVVGQTFLPCLPATNRRANTWRDKRAAIDIAIGERKPLSDRTSARNAREDKISRDSFVPTTLATTKRCRFASRTYDKTRNTLLSFPTHGDAPIATTTHLARCIGSLPCIASRNDQDSSEGGRFKRATG